MMRIIFRQLDNTRLTAAEDNGFELRMEVIGATNFPDNCGVGLTDAAVELIRNTEAYPDPETILRSQVASRRTVT